MREHETEGAETPPILFEDMDIDGWEVKLHQAVVRRQKRPGGHPDTDALRAMETVVARLTGRASCSKTSPPPPAATARSRPWACSSCPAP